MTKTIKVSIVWITASCILCGQSQATASKAIGVEQIKAVDHVGENRYALVIGINDYEDPEIPDLKTAENDARVMYELLIDPRTGGIDERNAYLLVGEKATTRNIRIHLNKLRLIPSKSSVFIYFSGHGAKEGDGACWITQDCLLDLLGATGITHIELRQFISRIPSDRVVVMLDCCYAAATVKEGKAIEGDFSDVLSKFTGKGRAYLMAAGSGQEAIEAQDLKHSVFTHYLVEGMKGKSDSDKDGVIVLTELTHYIDSKVADEARIRGGVQRPVVRMDNVTEPSKFGLTIDAERIARNFRETAEARALREKRLLRLRSLALDEQITVDQYQQGRRLLTNDVSALSSTDQQKRIEYLRVVDGDLEAAKLTTALSLIQTPEQRKARLERQAREQARRERERQQRLEREARERAERERKNKFSSLMAQARAKDNKQDGKEALSLLEEALKLDPGNTEALALQKKIQGYFGGNPGDVMTNSIGMKLVWIPPGEFMMGSPSSEKGRDDDEGPVHRVKISKGFWMGQTEVTRGQFAAFIEESRYKTDAEKEGWAFAWRGSSWGKVEGASWRDPGFTQSDTHPVVCVSWNDAKAFCDWLRRKESGVYRLPTEAEWEYACRSGSSTTFCWGDNADDGSGWCNAADLTAKEKFSGWTTFNWRDGYIYTAPFGNFRSNSFGLYDMHGNVWEWCNDWYDEDYYSQSPIVDPQGPSSGTYRVLRGGSWINYPRYCRSAVRDGSTPGYRIYSLGFRVVFLDF
jgi:formylglycine-generating enzyme required for sulfatase activity